MLDTGRQKTEQMNEKLKAADKGDLLDFKLDGSSVQTFEGVDYSSSALAHAKAQAEMLGIFDIGKRERKEANYNENSLYQQQIAALKGTSRPKQRKEARLPKHMRLPRMEEWQMYDRERLQQLQEIEERAFKELSEEDQKKVAMKDRVPDISQSGEMVDETFVVPALLSKEENAEKEKLLQEGFSGWNKFHYQAFCKASAVHGRSDFQKIAIDIGKTDEEVKEFADAFWGDRGKSRISEHEYDRVVKLIERGEKKIGEVQGLERGTKVLISLFDNPWRELEFTYVNCKDKTFTAEEDRYLLCWTRKVRI
jgi:SWI/SNF-related matrix-associated actin-dependent regulator of chromatin subfamily A member 5